MCIRVAIRAPKLKASTIQKVRAENYRFPPHVQNSSYFKTCSLLASFIILNELGVSTLVEQNYFAEKYILYTTLYSKPPFCYFWINVPFLDECTVFG